MEVGCCAWEGAAKRGDGDFVLFKDTNPDAHWYLPRRRSADAE